jgi:hypothetical protein
VQHVANGGAVYQKIALSHVQPVPPLDVLPHMSKLFLATVAIGFLVLLVLFSAYVISL